MEFRLKEVTYLAALTEAMSEEMERDDSVFLMGQGVQSGGSYKTAVGLLDRFGSQRVRDVPIAEDSVVGCAVGAALMGMKPIVEILYCDFTLRAMDQIANQAAKIRYMTGGQMNVPLVIRTTCGFGSSRGAHHSQSLEATFSHFPGLKVALPSSPADAKGLLKSAIRDPDPVLFIDHFLLFPTKGPIPEGEFAIPLGKAEIKREGTHVTLVAFSTMVHESLRAAQQLASEGIDVEIVDPRTLVPLDIAAMVVEAGCKRGGVGAEIIQSVMEEAFDFLDSPPVRLAVPNTSIPFAARMEEFVIPDQAAIAKTIQRMVRK
jgi:pyruvate/2-oxoglutarate/acetoin dehydrogenase E1 component